MFRVIEERTFLASHKIQFPNGTWEPLHEHKWLLRVEVCAKKLDKYGLVVDFLELQKYMDDALAPFIGQSFNQAHPFSEGHNPTAEAIVFWLYQQIAPHIDNERVQVTQLELREAPTSWACYQVPFQRENLSPDSP